MTDSSSPSSPETLSEGKLKKFKKFKKPNKKKAWNIIIIVAIVFAIGLFTWSEQSRRSAVQQMEDTARQLEEIKASSQRSGEDIANEILEKVNVLINIPLDPKPTVAKITDINRLKEANEFFGAAEDDDYLILTGNRAILYDPDRNIVLDMAPFRINRESPTPSSAAGSQQSTSQTESSSNTSDTSDEEE